MMRAFFQIASKIMRMCFAFDLHIEGAKKKPRLLPPLCARSRRCAT
jgi:hypothetical protein